MITSAANPKIKALRALYERRGRQETRAYIIEGVRLVEEALQAGIKPRLLYYCPSLLATTPRGAALLARLASLPVKAGEVSERALAAAADTVTPQGILAVVPLPSPPILSLDASLILILDGLQDPGNLGTILRTALAAAVDAVITTPGSADPYAPKVVRAGMGAHFRLPILADTPWPEIAQLAAGRHTLLAVPQDGIPYDQVDWRKPTVIIIGGEAQGAGTQAQALATARVNIPMAAGVESLNAAIATGVLLFEAYRQRTNKFRTGLYCVHSQNMV